MKQMKRIILLLLLAAFTVAGAITSFAGLYKGRSYTVRNFFSLHEVGVDPPLKETMLEDGLSFNIALKMLDGTIDWGDYDGAQYNTKDTKIRKIQLIDSVPADILNYTKMSVEEKGQQYPVYAWYDSGTIYLASEADPLQKIKQWQRWNWQSMICAAVGLSLEMKR